MEIVIHRPRWKFWRRPLWGLNPWSWQELRELPPLRTTVEVRGYSRPGDGGGGLYAFVSAEAEKDVWIAPDDSTPSGTWLQPPNPPAE